MRTNIDDSRAVAYIPGLQNIPFPYEDNVAYILRLQNVPYRMRTILMTAELMPLMIAEALR